ncbi:MAG: Mrp/NBP35 family ATP-binding protein [Coriobacteriales bacterium]|nr:Mrp/NBP35 family ATP-binding protein [Coriobacteriales bacterium]
MTPEEEEAIRREFEAARKQGHSEQPAAAQEEPSFDLNPFSRIHHVIGVVSGKGGVGKSLVTGILARELARKGNRVGILDADVTGPSIPRMFGLGAQKAMGMSNLIVPVSTAGGIKVMSANLVLEHEDDPVLWRGPLLAGIIRQFWAETYWEELDYLLVDMPPGTGDVALTVFQSLPIDGVVIVSSPQDLVQMVVGKAVNMASMMEVPVYGLVENMAYISCPHCGEKVFPYGPSRLSETAAHYGLSELGQLPIDESFALACDKGAAETDLPDGLLPDAIAAITNA